MTLQEYVDLGGLILEALAVTGICFVIVILAFFTLAAGIMIIYFHATEYLQSRFGGKSK